ncbi:WD40 repeat domain-containing protein [Gordonia shandongensis]|uniref:WD40 repeat domain-containing protein n=1 Tax=Gordonia shandongensis TaxID=376351 RepID=UPI000413A4FE|nr:WD40 repeat domain-containing protein [Gordonia shandongensis]
MTPAQPESEFGPALARLFVQAGRPKLRTVTEQMSRAGLAEYTPQRISDWRNGRHVPKDYETVAPLIMWLTRRALDNGADDLISLPEWRELWQRHHDPASAGPSRTLASPFPGLASMGADDRDRYFGRGDTIDTLVGLLDRARQSSDNRVVIVTGVSGAGKSSLLGAGLARAAAPWNTPLALRAAEVAQSPTEDPGAVVVIDQFEEVFALDAEQRRDVLDAVERMSTAGTVVVLGIRADFFGACVEIPMLASAWQDRSMIVAEMTDDQLREVITEPVRLAGGRIDAGLVDLMIDDLHQTAGVGDRAGRLPLLAHALRVTWARRTANRLTVASYRAAGGITSALADTAEETWRDLDVADHPEARAVLLALVQFGPHRTVMRGSVAPTEIATRFPVAGRRIVDAFADARLLTVSGTRVMFIHDAVMTSWPRMAEWIAEDADLLQWRQQLEADSTAWEQGGRRADYLYSGTRLAAAMENRRDLGEYRQSLLPAGAADFLDAAERQARLRRRLRIGAVALVVILGLASAITAVIATRQSADLTEQRNRAEYSALMSSIDGLVRSDPSLAARLLAVAEHHYPDDLGVRSGLLAAATTPLAQRLDGHSAGVFDVTFSADGRVMATGANDRTARLWVRASRHHDPESGATPPFRPAAVLGGFADYVTSATIDPSGTTLAAASGDGTIRVWNVADVDAPRLLGVLRPGAGTVYLTRFSPSGRHLVTSSDNGTAVVYSVDGVHPPRQTAVLRGHTGAVRTLAYSVDGTMLATGSEDQTVRLWRDADTDTPRPAGEPLRGFPSIAHGLAFLPGDRTLAVTGDSGDVQMWDVSDPARAQRLVGALPGATGPSWSLSASPSQPLLAQASMDGSVHVWNVTDPGDPLPLWDLEKSAAPGAVRMLTTEFSPDGHTLAVGRGDGGVDIWHFPDTALIDRGASDTGVALSSRGDLLLTTGTDARLKLWTRDDGSWRSRGSVGLEKRANTRPRVAISADGRVAVTANNNGGLLEVWDVSDRDRPRRAGEIRVDTRYTSALAFAPGTSTLAAGVDDRTVGLWDLSDPAAPARMGPVFSGPGDLIRSTAFSPNGRRLVVTSDDGKAYLYQTAGSGRPSSVVTAGDAVRSALFADDGDHLVVAAGGLSVWDVETGGEPEKVADLPNQHAEALGRSGDRLYVVTGTREVAEFELGDDGSLIAGPTVSPLLGGSRSTASMWVIPTNTGANDDYPVTGDGSGVLYLQPTDREAGRRWICASTDELTDDQRDRYLGSMSGTDGC